MCSTWQAIPALYIWVSEMSNFLWNGAIFGFFFAVTVPINELTNCMKRSVGTTRSVYCRALDIMHSWHNSVIQSHLIVCQTMDSMNSYWPLVDFITDQLKNFSSIIINWFLQQSSICYWEVRHAAASFFLIKKASWF